MPRQVMCPKHWAMVPDAMKEAIRLAKHDRTSAAWTEAVKNAADEVRFQIRLRREIESWVDLYGDEAV